MPLVLCVQVCPDGAENPVLHKLFGFFLCIQSYTSIDTLNSVKILKLPVSPPLHMHVLCSIF